MPYEVLYSKKPNLEKLPVWGCQVKVHDITGSKLDMRTQDSHWVGFDPELDGHHIYFVDHGNIGVEQSVVFACQDETVTLMSVNVQPVGEREHSPNGSNGEPNVDIADANVPSNEPVHEISQHTMPAEDVPSHLGDGFKCPLPEPVLRRSTWQRFESEYFKRLNASEGTTDGRTTHLNEMAKAVIKDLFKGTTCAGECPDDDANVFAMVAGVAEAEVLDPLGRFKVDRSCSRIRIRSHAELRLTVY